MGKFNIKGKLNAAVPKYTGEDIRAEKPVETEEKIGYFPDLSKVLSSEPEPPHRSFNLKIIPREKIQFNKNNDFEIVQIEELANSILKEGLIHNFAAIYDEDGDVYILESGERRLRACDYLHSIYSTSQDQEGYEDYKANVEDFYISGFPVNIKRKKYQDDEDLSPIDFIESDLRKYTANIEVREFSPQERAAYISKIKALWQEKNRLLGNEKEEVLDTKELANLLNISEKQVKKYEAIEGLIPELKQEFELGNLSINKVPSISKMPADEQAIVVDFIRQGKSIELEKIQEQKEALENLKRDRKLVEDERDAAIQKNHLLLGELQDFQKQIAAEKEEIERKSIEKAKQLQKEIEQALLEKNQEEMLRLQENLEKEKEISRKLLSEADRKLEKARKELREANTKISDLEEQKSPKELEKKLQLQLEIHTNIKFLENICVNIKSSIQELRSISTEEDMGEIQQRLQELLQNIL